MLGRTCLSAASSRPEGPAVVFLTIFCSLASLSDGQTEGVLATTAAPVASEGCYDTHTGHYVACKCVRRQAQAAHASSLFTLFQAILTGLGASICA